MLKLKPFRETPGLCGPASLKIVMDYYGVSVSEADIARVSGATQEKGVSTAGLAKAAKHFGFKTLVKENSSLDDLRYYVKKEIPVMVDWFSEDDGHYSPVVGLDDKYIYLQDTQIKKVRKMGKRDFTRVWFDFPGDRIKTPKDLILRLMLVIIPKGKNLLK